MTRHIAIENVRTVLRAALSNCAGELEKAGIAPEEWERLIEGAVLAETNTLAVEWLLRKTKPEAEEW